MEPIPLFGALPGGPEMLIILVIVVLLFGANKLPQLARSSGQALGEFKRGREEIEREIASRTDDARASGSSVEGTEPSLEEASPEL